MRCINIFYFIFQGEKRNSTGSITLFNTSIINNKYQIRN
jgi:hypothetical protein